MICNTGSKWSKYLTGNMWSIMREKTYGVVFTMNFIVMTVVWILVCAMNFVYHYAKVPTTWLNGGTGDTYAHAYTPGWYMNQLISLAPSLIFHTYAIDMPLLSWLHQHKCPFIQLELATWLPRAVVSTCYIPLHSVRGGKVVFDGIHRNY